LYVMMMIGICFLSYGHSTAFGLAMVEVRNLANAVATFQYEYGEYPAPANWFEELTGGEKALINVRKKVYVDPVEKTDPWGSEYQYALLDTGSVKLPMIYSLGRDKISKTFGHDPDDISSWREEQIPLAYYRPPLFTTKRIVVGTLFCIGYGFLLLYLRAKRMK